MLQARFRPLDRWPKKTTPSYQRERGRYRASYATTLDELERELSKLKAKNVVIEAGFLERDIRNDGWPRSSARPKAPGVILNFEMPLGGERVEMVLPCDKFVDWEDNLRAIAQYLLHLRKADQNGISNSGETYRGWAKLPPASGSSTLDTVIDFIASKSGYKPNDIRAHANIYEAARRTAAHACHPDRGATRETWDDYQRACMTLDAHHGIKR